MSTEPEFSLTEEQAQQLYSELGKHLVDQESKFDSNIVLVGGGAFTVSAVLLERMAAPWHWGMTVAWFAWGLSLLVTCGSYLISTAGSRRRIRTLQSGERRASALQTWHNSVLPWFSSIAFSSLVVGLAFFGYVIYSGVSDGKEGGQARGQEGGQEQHLLHQAEGQSKEPGYGAKPAAGAASAPADKASVKKGG